MTRMTPIECMNVTLCDFPDMLDNFCKKGFNSTGPHFTKLV
jgi:hypothetical protein